MKILSIDAWGDTEPKSWTWNNWFHAGDISKDDFEKLDTDKKIATWFMENGFTTTNDMRRIVIEDDQYNIVLCDKKTREPIFAIEYGAEY